MVMKRRHKRIAFIVLGLCGLGIAAALALSAGVRAEDILISVVENGYEDWYAGRL